MRSVKKYRFEILCIAPLVIFLFAFTLAPIIRTVALSFKGPFLFSNYKELLTQPAFRKAFFNTIFIACTSLSFELLLGLSLALFLAGGKKGDSYLSLFPKKRYLSPFFLPLAIPTVVVGVIMGFMFSTSGWVNRILTDILPIASPVQWTDGGIKSLFMIAMADTWKVTPIVMLILLSGIESIDRNLYEAANVDGAGRIAVFKRITLPLLMPYITACVIIRGIDAFRIFALPLILMGQNLKVIGTYAYLEYMEYNNVHLSAASSVILLCMILTAVAVYIKAVGRKGIAID